MNTVDRNLKPAMATSGARAIDQSSLPECLVDSGFDLNVTQVSDVSRGATFGRFSSGPDETQGVTPDVWWLGIHHRNSRADLREWDKRIENCMAFPGDLILVAPSTEYEVKLRDPVENSSLFIDTDLVRQLLPEKYHNRAPFEGLPCNFFRSPLIFEISAQLGLLENNAQAADTLYAEALISALLMDLARIAGDREAATFRPAREADLTQQHLRLLNDYIDEHAASSIKTADLAGIVGMHPSNFQRSFKAVTKTTHYQYVLARRLAKAQHLLVSTRQSPAQIAFECGFASQSHMSDVFRRRLGKTPGNVRTGA
jgi:AraC-like DNA-binding protein